MKTLKKTTLLFIFILISVPVLSQEVGLQLYSLRNQFKADIEGTLKTINSWGITKIEGGESYGMPTDDFKVLLKNNKLTIVSIGASFDDLEKNIDKVIKNAKAYNTKYVMCPWVPHNDNEFAFKEIKHATDVFNKAGKQLKKEGFILAYHPHGYEFRPYEDGTLFDYMAKNATDFTFEIDVFWAHHGGGDPLKLLKKYPKKVTLLHLKDMKHGVKGNNTGQEDVETNVVLGQGQVDIAGVVAEAKKIGIEYMFIEDESSRVVEQVPLSLEFLQKLK